MAEDMLKILKLSQAGVREHLGGLLLRGELIYQPPTTTYCRTFKSTLNRDFERDLRLASDRWTMRLIDEQPNLLTDFILGAVEEDKPLFSGVSLAFFTSVEDHEIAGLQAVPWLQADNLDLKALSDDGRAGISTLGKKTLADMMQDPTSLSSKAY
ncbi:hypothetical protein BCV69DRAFT_299987 [Microstroma glucosiphilum]|uniref:Uncharacterized protein n=1 Tax=Pseudomicrostroma glucosiphilum TaxID=1684307 RepID=A0A316U355_9BASI|nr:hypothetical protein BCV69DRAFT_299987 [Pseudomicrostroma glucosiphilum]PWN19677.1 hypothetical protein BCV69DRAFT_299987 [Pseudomicrostroma glucosiphilum]